MKNVFDSMIDLEEGPWIVEVSSVIATLGSKMNAFGSYVLASPSTDRTY